MSKKNDIINESLENEIKNYGNKIQELKDIVEAVRKIPDVYIGALGNAGYLTMYREILQNSLDEILKKVAMKPVVEVWFDERTKVTTVQDYGRGIPHGKMATIFGSLHTSSNYNKNKGEYSAGKNGQGGSLVCMLSHNFMVDSYVLGKGKHAEFVEGHIWNKGEIDIPKSDGKQGSTITFNPNQDVLGQLTVTWKDVYDLTATIVPLVPGATVLFTAYDSGGIEHFETIENIDGLITHLINISSNPLIKPICMADDNGEMKAEIAFTYDPTLEETIVGFGNTCPTISGTHMSGLEDGICKFFRDYMNKVYLANQKSKNPLIIVSNDIKYGLVATISTFHLHARFTGQSKEILSNEDMKPFVMSLVIKGLDTWSKNNPADLKKLCAFFKDVAELRVQETKGKTKLSDNYTSSVLSAGMPAKYIKPNGKEHLELIIVEGNSAIGPVREGRDPKCQGGFPIRGKMPNAFTTKKETFLKNEEVSAILTILGAGYGKSFDITKCKWEKVIIMADADPDGKHIRTLLFRFFLLYCEPLITSGRLYGAVPPLYSAMVKGKNIYFTEKIDYIKYIQKQFALNNTICDMSGKQLSQKQLSEVLYRNMDYVYEMDIVSHTYAINPYLLENILIHRNMSYKQFKAELEKIYRFITVSQYNGITVIDGLVDDKYHTIFLNEKIYKACETVIKYIDGSFNHYILNGETVSLYYLMKYADKSKPKGLQRLKGLGEQNPNELAESTMLPNSDRLLIRYNIEDVKKELELIKTLDTDRASLMKDIQVSKEDVMG